MTIWPPRREDLVRPVYHSLAQCLVRAVEAGELAAGTQLPTHRALAFDLGLSVQTVSRAYEELTRLGVISGHVGRGSFVLSRPPDTPLPWHRLTRGDGVIDCSMLVPVTGEIHAERFSQVLRQMADDPPYQALFSFRPRETLLDHCDKARKWLAGCGLDLDGRDRILATNGNTAAMTCALMTAARPGDLVVTEELGHHTLKSLTASLGLKLTGLAIDEQGLLPDAFERACRNGPVKVLYLMPAGLGPTAAMMTAERRAALVEIARRHSVWIVENDAWGPLQPDRPVPIAALAPERTFFFTGLTKCILPGLRIAWLVPPEAMMHAARSRHLVTNWMATPIMAEIASRWIADGTAAELLDWQRTQLARRNRLVDRVLGGVPHRSCPVGMHVWLPLPEIWREEEFVALARQDGVAVAAGANFAIDDARTHRGIRICIGVGTEAELEEGLRVLVRLVSITPEPALLAI
jgi:DNA-binding transcriptional MocR family regulator